MPSRYCDSPYCLDPDCRDLRLFGKKADEAWLAKRVTHEAWCDSLIPSMSTNPCDCGALEKKRTP